MKRYESRYEFHRGGRIEETVRLGGEEIRVSLDCDAAAEGFLRLSALLQNAEAKLKELGGGRAAALEQYGEAIIEVIRLVFGEDGAEKLLGFFEGNYVGLSAEVVPFVAGVVVPGMRAAVAERKRRLERYYSGDMQGRT